MINLDTHILLHALRGDVKPREREILTTDSWGIASIVLWEISKLVQLGRVALDLEDPEVTTALSSVHVWPPGSRDRATPCCVARVSSFRALSSPHRW